jgi:hypothetical protein
LILNIKNSKTLLGIALGTHLGAGLIALALPLPLPMAVRVLLAGAVTASLIWWCRRPADAVELKIETDGSCALRSADGSAVGYRVLCAARHAGCVRLVLVRDGGRARVLWVLPDAVAPEHYRQLCAAIAQRRLPAHQVPV